jgi:hypothetical protein
MSTFLFGIEFPGSGFFMIKSQVFRKGGLIGQLVAKLFGPVVLFHAEGILGSLNYQPIF